MMRSCPEHSIEASTLSSLGTAFSVASKSIATELRNMGESAEWMPAEGSLLRSQRQEWIARNAPVRPDYRDPFASLTHVMLARSHAISDFLDGLATLAEADDERHSVMLSFSPITRSVYEALAYVYWLMEEEVTPEERVLRLCRDLLYSMLTENRLTDFTSAEDASQFSARWDGLEELFAAWGVETEWRQAAEVKRHLVLPGLDKRPPAQEIMHPLLETPRRRIGGVIYADSTSIAHASVDGILRRADISHREDGGTHFHFDRDNYLRATAVVVWATARPLGALATTMGWDNERLTEVTRSGIERLTELARPDA